MRIYIAGPVNGTDDFIKRFGQAEERLINRGYKVYNPAHANSYMPEGTTYDEFMKVGFTLLDMSDAIYLLKGWENSRGANQEYGYAIAKGLVVFREEDSL